MAEKLHEEDLKTLTDEVKTEVKAALAVSSVHRGWKIGFALASLGIALLVLALAHCPTFEIKRLGPNEKASGLVFYRPAAYLLVKYSQVNKPVPDCSADVSWLPDVNERYEINPKSSLRSSEIGIALKDGWNLTAFNSKSDAPASVGASPSLAAIASSGTNTGQVRLFKILFEPDGLRFLEVKLPAGVDIPNGPSLDIAVATVNRKGTAKAPTQTVRKIYLSGPEVSRIRRVIVEGHELLSSATGPSAAVPPLVVSCSLPVCYRDELNIVIVTDARILRFNRTKARTPIMSIDRVTTPALYKPGDRNKKQVKPVEISKDGGSILLLGHGFCEKPRITISGEKNAIVLLSGGQGSSGPNIVLSGLASDQKIIVRIDKCLPDTLDVGVSCTEEEFIRSAFIKAAVQCK